MKKQELNIQSKFYVFTIGNWTNLSEEINKRVEELKSIHNGLWIKNWAALPMWSCNSTNPVIPSSIQIILEMCWVEHE